MNFARLVFSAMTASAIFATSAQAGCNCNVPPSPAAFPVGGGGWNGGNPGYGQDFGPGSAGQFSPGVGSPMGAMPYGGAVATNGPHWAPGGYEPRMGSPAYFYDPSGGQYVVTGDPYSDHFGPGFHRNSIHGHYRFPYYNYRAPWYFPGRAVYNRNTNFAW